MMSGGDIDPIKARRSGPESVEHAEGFVANVAKNFTNRANRRRDTTGK
jgi:hypothetical protein